MSEYESPLQNIRDDSQSNEQGNETFLSSSSSRKSEESDNWYNNRSPHTPYRGRHFRFRGQSTPYNRNRGRGGPFPGRGNFNQRQGDFKSEHYFHPSMLENPWAELEKKFEEFEKNNKLCESDSSSSSDSENE